MSDRLLTSQVLSGQGTLELPKQSFGQYSPRELLEYLKNSHHIEVLDRNLLHDSLLLDSKYDKNNNLFRIDQNAVVRNILFIFFTSFKDKTFPKFVNKDDFLKSLEEFFSESNASPSDELTGQIFSKLVRLGILNYNYYMNASNPGLDNSSFSVNYGNIILALHHLQNNLLEG